MKELLCITCPMCCQLKVEWQNGELSVEGNGCKRGVDFAKSEMTHPMRSLTTTVRTVFSKVPVLPVRTDGEIPKEKMADAMRELSGVVIDRPLGCGDTVIENIQGSGCRVIATSDILREGDIYE